MPYEVIEQWQDWVPHLDLVLATSTIYSADEREALRQLQALSDATVAIDDGRHHFGDPGYRDALCTFITHEVTAVKESPEAGLVIRFGVGEIVTNPEPTDLGGPEIAQLQLRGDSFRDEAWMVWRPGEDVFAGLDWS